MGIRADADGWALILLALLCLTAPLNWLLAALIAAGFHEFCHFLGVWLTGGRIHSLRIGTAGAVMEASPMTPGRELVSVLAGPAGSIALFFLYPLFPRVAICALVHGLFNLLPIYPLDGGRALVCGTELLFSKRIAEKICVYTRWTVAILVMCAGIWGTFIAKLGTGPVLMALFLLSRALAGKIPCKRAHLGVQ